MHKYLSQVNTPSDLKKIPVDDLPALASEIRDMILDAVSTNGGHLGANLGAVELTIALHYVYNSPHDKMIFDVSHQSYTHKILTERKDRFHTIRTAGGLSGFTSRAESDYDPFGTGHACTAISSAHGLAVARDLRGQNHNIIAVVGDGALTGGMSWEGLNQLGASGRKSLVVLNDNNMSISKNVGAIAKYLTEMLSDQPYNKIKNEIWRFSGMLPKHERIRNAVAALDESIKGFMLPGIVFEKFGFRYFGPIDGHDIKLLVKTLHQIKALPGPKLLHILTVKGKGYSFAETDSLRLHGVSKFDKITGKSLSLSKSLPYTKVFGEALTHLAHTDKSICAITAAMCSGTGLEKFAQEHPKRFFDVGIAEQHGVTFASGLAAGGMKPFFAVYSSFLQRGFDQVMHDAALQKLPVVFCLDRAGIVGEDGPTHHGCFDISYLRSLPGVTIIAPKDGRELRDSLMLASRYDKGPVVIRYPRADVPEETVDMAFSPLEFGTWETIRDGNDAAILAVGSMVYPAWKAAEILARDGFNCKVVNCRFVKPLDTEILRDISEKYDKIVTVCENAIQGGFGESIQAWMSGNNDENKSVKILGIPDRYIEHGPREMLLHKLGLDAEGIAMAVLEMHQKAKERSHTRKSD